MSSATTLKPLKILHITGAMNCGGTETMLMNIFRNVDRKQVQFDFVSFSKEDAYYDKEIRELGGTVIKLSNNQSVKELVRIMKEYGPYDAVHSHTLFHCGIANSAAMLAGIHKRIAHAHTTLDDSESISRKLYIRGMRSLTSAVSTHLLACSNEAGRYLFGPRQLKKRRFSYFPNLIDYSSFLEDHQKEVSLLKEELGLKNVKVIGHIGRFIAPKNHSYLLKIFKEVLKKEDDFKLLLVGDGDLRSITEAEVKKEGLEDKVIFTGIRKDIDILLKCMDIFVFPSVYEGLGLVLLEAQASGLPCVVSEAVQPEADIEVGLVTKLSLEQKPEEWAEEVLSNVCKKETDKKRIIKAFENKGYSMSGGISSIISIYRE
ncbi:glycosyltransferase family 1 protein [Evansella sp. LMS18]|uniref:glycosyltransferase family 1 protein n=1 Tax=Evansella sp. LMS18 TaxID=2924033 RepID=UPI0020D10A7C|nr:glycosyltransferase family 1 protein [Evansella sp. LMS18]UTR10579.1 glycosyltransferase family 1 protein [Evansella sp. LMS18]